jgi:hypothetical protein
MKLRDVLARAPHWYAARKSIYLRSAPGRGKTETLLHVPQLLMEAHPGKRFGIVVLNGGCFTLTNATGYLWPEEHTGENGESHRYSQFTRPDWWLTSEGYPLEAYDGGIIFIDEWDKMDVESKKITGEAALSGRLASHQLPEGWVVWGAGNRAEDRSGSTKELDHLINRRREINIQDDLESLLEWGARNGLLPETLTFIEANPNVVFEPLPEKQGPWCTPRGVAGADRYLRGLAEANGGVIPTDATTIEEVAGDIGPGAAAQYFAMIRLGLEMPKYEAIVQNPTSVKVPNKIDAQMLVSHSLAARVSVKDAGQVLKYVDRMPKEFAVSFARSAIQREARLATSPDFAKWIGANSALISLMQRVSG